MDQVVLNRNRLMTRITCSRPWWALIAVLTWDLAPAAPVPATPAMINVTVGEVGIADDQSGPTRFGLEYRFAPVGRWQLIPALGAAGAANGARFVYADLRYDLWLSDSWLLIPSFGPGLFDNGRDLDLGQKLEFRSGLEIAWRFYRHYRIGLAVFHLSNGGLSERNPGTEALVLSLCIPVATGSGERP